MGEQLADLQVVSELVVELLPLWPAPSRGLRMAPTEQATKRRSMQTHSWVPLVGPFQCARCLQTAPAAKRTRCIMKGSAAAFFRQLGHHVSMRRYTTSGGCFLACRLCGAYGGDKAHKLQEPCLRSLLAGGKRTISRLQRGLHPKCPIEAAWVGGADFG